MQAEIAVNNIQEKKMLAQEYASSDFVPENFKRKPGNTMIAMDIANRSGSPVLEVMNNIFIDRSGRLGFQTPYAISMANRLGPFKHPICWKTEKKDDDIIVTAYSKLKVNGQEVSSPPISYKKVKEAGWTSTSKGVKAVYIAEPLQMLRYKSALMLIRSYCAEVLFGMATDLDASFVENHENSTTNHAIEKINEEVRGD